MSATPDAWQTQNLDQMVQSGRRATATARQTAPIDLVEIDLIVAPWPDGIPPSLILPCRKDGLEQPSETPAFRLTGNCVALAFGTDARRIARNLPFQPAAPAALRRGLQVWSSVPPESTVRENATVALVQIVTGAIGGIAGSEAQGKHGMKIELQSGIIVRREPIVKDNLVFRDRLKPVNGERPLRMFR